MTNVIFMGTSSFALNILKCLIASKGINVTSLFTQPDKCVGRKQLITPPIIKQYLLDDKSPITIHQPPTLRDDEVVKTIQNEQPDFIIVADYGQILPKTILDLAPCINLHGSLLPQYRGASPIQTALLNGDKQTGVTAILMDEGLDSGDILAYDIIDIAQTTNAIELFDELSNIAGLLTLQVLESYKEIAPVKQYDALATYTKKIKKEDGQIVFDDAQTIYQKYRAFIHWPNVFTKEGLKLKHIALNNSTTTYPKEGIILEVAKSHITVSTLKGALDIYELQPPSKKAMKATDYIKGKRIGIGDSLL